MSQLNGYRIVPSNSEEPKRIRKFRLEIAKQIPKFPNNRYTLALLESKSLASLLIDYTNWILRYVPSRPRTVCIEPTATADRRWRLLATETKALLEKVRLGADLTPHLSLKVRRQGFTPMASSVGPNGNKWADKDFLLNVMGFHHFHLSSIVEKSGNAKRTDDVLFAQVTRYKFSAIGFFNHSVFETTKEPGSEMLAERERLWKIFDERAVVGIAPGTVCISSPIATSGHSLHHTRLAMDYARMVNEIDPKLDDPLFRSALFPGIDPASVRALKPIWHLHYLDLCLLDKKSKTFSILKKGPC